jgi:ornithine cyclodeaminase
MNHEIRIFTEAQIRKAVALDLQTIDVTAGAFTALAEGGVVMPPILSMELVDNHGEVDVKTAYLPGRDSFALKVSTGFYNNAALGIASLNGLMILFSARTGLVEAVMLDNGFLTDLRTAAAGAVAARALAPQKVETACVMGTGLQARMQIEAAHLVRPFSRVLVWGRDRAKAQSCAEDITRRIGVEARVESDPARAVAESQLVITTTPAREPILKAEWLHPRLHITAMGSDMALKQELEAQVLAAADLYVCDRVSQCEMLGELRAARASGLMRDTTPPELGQVLNGTHPGRQSQDAITVCDLTGTGAQDTVIATHVNAILKDAGTVIRA